MGKKHKPMPWRYRRVALREAKQDALSNKNQSVSARNAWRIAYREAREAARVRARTLRSPYRVRIGRVRQNPSLDIVTRPVKAAMPIAAGLYASRFLANTVGPRVPGLSSLGQHAAPVTAVGVLAVTSYVGPKVIKNQSTRAGVMVGMGISVIDTLLKTYAPESVRGPIGLKDVYDDALTGMGAPYQEMGDYVQLNGYVSD